MTKLVLGTFKGFPEDYRRPGKIGTPYYVKHKDGDKSNCSLDNLE